MFIPSYLFLFVNCIEVIPTMWISFHHVGAITCWQSIPLRHVSSVTDIIERSLGVVIVDHVLCDCFSFKEGFTSCCHTNAACRFGTYVSNKKPILPSETGFIQVSNSTWMWRRILKEDPSVFTSSAEHWNISVNLGHGPCCHGCIVSVFVLNSSNKRGLLTLSVLKTVLEFSLNV